MVTARTTVGRSRLTSAPPAAIPSLKGILVVPKRLGARRAFARATLHDPTVDKGVKGTTAHLIAAHGRHRSALCFGAVDRHRLGRGLAFARGRSGLFWAGDRTGHARRIDGLDHLAGLSQGIG